ncbi:peptidase S8/S53 domain-containing protein [Lipomyces japonicus]|uniref:peptidase S8/S53 domain-containing protein n=1 Tax=Lipomyces japonicus TaxID=56871 RepID=UPI0034CE67A3
MVKFTVFLRFFLLAASAVAAVGGDDDDDDNVDTNFMVMPGRYLVVLRPHLSAPDVESHFTWLFNLTADHNSHVVRKFGAWMGQASYAGRFGSALATVISRRADVASVEPEAVFRASLSAVNTQANAGWNLARLSSREPVNTTAPAFTFQYGPDPGSGVTVFVLDTGVRASHVDLAGRVTGMVNLVSWSANTDRHGHGTHVAAIAAGTNYGVAKRANLVAVKVLNDHGAGTTVTILEGIQYVVRDHVRRQRQATGRVDSVINLSLGGRFSPALNLAVRAAVRNGVHVVVAAGNAYGKDACQFSPASEPSVITVAASTMDDMPARFSNLGPCVDVFAPGVNILSASAWSDSAQKSLSGTSMAAPLVAGLTAYLISQSPQNVALSVAQVKQQILQLATKNALSNLPSNTGNYLAYNGIH